MKTALNAFWTLNLEVASCLGKLGFVLKKEKPGHVIIDAKGRQRTKLFFEPVCKSEKYGIIEAKDVWKAWNRQPGETCELEKRNPQAYHEVRVMADFAFARIFLLGMIKDNAPIFTKQTTEAGDTLYMPADASPDLIERVRKMVSEN